MENLQEQVRIKLQNGERESDIRKFVRGELGLGKSQGNSVYNKIKNQLYFPSPIPPVSTSKSEDGNGLSFVSDRYCYNQNTDTYVINLKNHKSPLCISGAKHRAICRSYSSWIDDLSANEICVKYSLTPEVFSEYRKVFGLTKDREPLSIEEVVADTIDGNIQSIIEEKRFKIYQGYEKELWKDTQAKANKWDQFNARTLDILKLSLDGWEPPKQERVKKNPEVKNGLIFVAGLFDVHVGATYSVSDGFAGRDFDSKIACDNMRNYSDRIKQTVSSKKDTFSSCSVVVGGDFFNSCIDNFTRKGTSLHCDVINEKMFKLGLDALITFIDNMADTFKRVDVIFAKGNHESVILSYAGIAASKYFSFNPNITFDIPEAWAAIYTFNNVLAIVTHGGHDLFKASLPPVSLKLKSFIQEMLLSRKEDLSKYTQKIVLSGHRHAFAQIDFGSFEFYCCGSSVLGDTFSDSLNLRNNPRQNCLVIGQNYVEESLHYYF